MGARSRSSRGIRADGGGGMTDDWLLDMAYRLVGADFADYFDTFTDSECRKRVEEFNSNKKRITKLWGSSPPHQSWGGTYKFFGRFLGRLNR